MKSAERRKQILNAALKAFAEYGYERTSIAVICEKAGIARPTLYQYFNDKRSVFRELLEFHMQGIHEKLHARQQEADKSKSPSPIEAMQSFHRELIQEFADNSDFYKILFKEAKARNAETEDIVKGVMQIMLKEFVSEMKEEPASAAMTDEDIEFTVVYMIGGVMQIVEYYLFNDEHPLSIEKLAEKITIIENKIKGE